MSSTHTQPRLILLLAAIIAITPLAIDMYLPAIPVMAESMDTHIRYVQQSLSIFLAAYALGMLLFGPLADALGRRPMALFGLSGFALASLALTQVNSIEWFLTWRSLQAFCGAAATVVVPGIIRHLYQEHTAKGMSYMSLIMMLAPMLAPAIGSGLLWLGHWHGIFFLLAVYACVIGLLSWHFLPEPPRSIPETSTRVTLKQEALNPEVLNPEVLNTASSKTSAQTSPADFLRRLNFFDSYARVFSRRATRPLIATIMFTSFSFFCFLTAVPFIYIQFFGASEQFFSLLFGFNVSLLMLANAVNSRMVVRRGPQTMLRYGLIGAVISVLCLGLVTWLELGIWFTVLSIGPLLASMVLVSTNTDALIIMQFPHNSGTATAVTGTLRFGSGALAGPLLAWCYTGTPLPFALLMTISVAGVMVCRYWARKHTLLPH
jgi:DHA1 family bicyclomycin/chloramphenicol resistance-like MFS transporter